MIGPEGSHSSNPEKVSKTKARSSVPRIGGKNRLIDGNIENIKKDSRIIPFNKEFSVNENKIFNPNGSNTPDTIPITIGIGTRDIILLTIPERPRTKISNHVMR